MLKSVVPWALAAGLLVSFTASAGNLPQDFQPSAPRLLDEEMITASLAPMPAARTLRFAELPESGEASLPEPTKLADRFLRAPSGIALDSVLVPVGKAVPADLAFADEQAFLPAKRLVSAESEVGIFSAPGHFTARPRYDGGTGEGGKAAIAGASEGSATSPLSLPALASLRPDGASPSLPRAVTLASTTPAPVEPEIVVMPKGLAPAVAMLHAPQGNVLGEKPAGPNRPNYAELIDPDDMNREQRCLAEAIYFEARSEPPAGQAAVAQIVLNRVKSGLYPSSVCGVVYQNRHRYKACQFTFACEGRSLHITEPAPWKQAVRIAREVTDGKTYLSKVGNATHYHADYVQPYWARRLKKNETIGRHTFYALRPGQR